MLNVLRRKPTWYAGLCLSITLGFALPAHADDIDVIGEFIQEQNLAKPEATPQAQLQEFTSDVQQLGPALNSQSALIMDANSGKQIYQKNLWILWVVIILTILIKNGF